MFNNKFLKHDPLLEAVKSAQMEGEYRRQAEAIVNEEFGVYSRKAVIRENLAAYDAALEETYTALKEGNKENKEKKKEHEEKTGMEHIKKMGGFPGQSLKRTARELTKEEKADKDYDRDGKIESPKDEVWGSRLRAAKMAGKLKEEEQIDELKAPTAKTAHQAYDRAERSDDEMGDWSRSNRLYANLKKRYPGKSARNQKNTGKADLDAYNSHENHAKEYGGIKKSGALTKNSQKELKGKVKGRLGKHTAPHLPEETDYSAQDRAPVTKSAPKEDPSTPKSYPGAASSLTAGNPTSQRMSNAKAAVSPIKEAAYSAKAARAGKDIGKPGKMFSKIAAKAGEKYGSKERGEKVAGAILKNIRAKHVKEENLQELSAFGKAFAAAGGKNFTFGGKEYSGARADQKTSSVPTPPTKPAELKAPTTWADPGKKDYSASNTGVDKPTAPAPKAAPAPTMTSASPSTGAGAGVASLPGTTQTANITNPKPAMDPGSIENAKRKSGSLSESVQVGTSKYRIV
jgi:hypothetical protein